MCSVDLFQKAVLVSTKRSICHSSFRRSIILSHRFAKQRVQYLNSVFKVKQINASILLGPFVSRTGCSRSHLNCALAGAHPCQLTSCERGLRILSSLLIFVYSLIFLNYFFMFVALGRDHLDPSVRLLLSYADR